MSQAIERDHLLETLVVASHELTQWHGTYHADCEGKCPTLVILTEIQRILALEVMSDTQHTPLTDEELTCIKQNSYNFAQPGDTVRRLIAEICRLREHKADLLATCELADIWFDENMAQETSVSFQRLRHKITAAIAKAKPKG